MMKNIVRYIFIYTIGILFVGCNDNPMESSQDFCDYCYLNIEAPDLPMDENGYYIMEFLNNLWNNQPTTVVGIGVAILVFIGIYISLLQKYQ